MANGRMPDTRALVNGVAMLRRARSCARAMMAEIDHVAASMYRDATYFDRDGIYNMEQYPFFGELRVIDANRPTEEVVHEAFNLCADSIPF